MEWWGVDFHALTLKNRQGQPISVYGYDTGDPENTEITAPILQATWEANYDASYFEAKCEHLMANVLFTFNQTTYSTITDAYNAGYIDYSLTYGLDYNATGLSAWSIVASLLSFQAIDIGMPAGMATTILSGIIAAPIGAAVVYLAYKIIAGIIPFISGGSGD
jgi:ABC-type thiamin/hydroxymethylpyrimidine transport system permease subunit